MCEWFAGHSYGALYLLHVCLPHRVLLVLLPLEQCMVQLVLAAQVLHKTLHAAACRAESHTRNHLWLADRRNVQVVAANNNGICFVWSMVRSSGVKQSTNFEPLHRLKAHDRYILKCLISPDVRKLATTSCDRTVKIWNLDNYQCEQVLKGHTKWVWDAVFSVDAAYLVTASSDHTARLWDVERGTDIRQFKGHTKAAVCCALNDNAMDSGH